MIIPKNISLDNWAGNLVIDFPQDNIPLLKGLDWKTWGNQLILEDSFAENGAPPTTQYNDWETWAQAVFLAMANF